MLMSKELPLTQGKDQANNENGKKSPVFLDAVKARYLDQKHCLVDERDSVSRTITAANLLLLSTVTALHEPVVLDHIVNQGDSQLESSRGWRSKSHASSTIETEEIPRVEHRFQSKQTEKPGQESNYKCTKANQHTKK